MHRQKVSGQRKISLIARAKETFKPRTFCSSSAAPRRYKPRSRLSALEKKYTIENPDAIALFVFF